MCPTLRILPMLLGLTLLLSACGSPDRAQQEAERLLAAGDPVAAAERIRAALESDAESLELLLLAGEIALSTSPEEAYRPRLALHYAMRAERAGDHRDPRAAALLLRAWRANGGSEEADDLVQRGLAQVGHRDATAPRRRSPADRDLLEPTAANLQEQRRRDRARAAGIEPCVAPMGFVASATYPLPSGGEAAVAPFCVDRASIPGTCAARGLRSCGPEERSVACGPMASVLGPHPACAEPTAERCCGSSRDATEPAAR